MELKGIAVSPGYAQGSVFFLSTPTVLDRMQKQTIADPSAELIKLNQSLQQACEEIQTLAEQLKSTGRSEQAEIFEAHVLMVQDPEIFEGTKHLIETQNISAYQAYGQMSEQYVQMLEKIDDEYLRARAVDVKDISERVLRILSGQKAMDLSQIPAGTVIVAHDVTPSQMALLDVKKVNGFITEIGGKTSHTAILARSLEIPAISGVAGAIGLLQAQDQILIDALKGEIVINPSREEVNLFQLKKMQFEETKKKLGSLAGLASVTKDGREITLAANIGTIHDLPSLVTNDAEAVGLYRTEFVFLDKKTLPTEQEQFVIYKDIFDQLKGKKCVIRTLDIGGDKQVAALPLPHEMNPFLGLRAIRLCLQEKNLFKEQLRAILRAAVGCPVGLMIPMISSIEEILETKKVIEECKQELRSQGLAFSNEIEFGVMIEIPTAALMVDLIARHVDFISVGTNDLTQYMCAVDRLNSRVEALYNPYNPGFLRALNFIFQAANKGQIHSAICGSLAHSELLLPVLIGMGVQELSMTAQHILGTRKMIRELNYEKCQRLVTEVLQLETTDAIQNKLTEFSQKI